MSLGGLRSAWMSPGRPRCARHRTTRRCCACLECWCCLLALPAPRLRAGRGKEARISRHAAAQIRGTWNIGVGLCVRTPAHDRHPAVLTRQAPSSAPAPKVWERSGISSSDMAALHSWRAHPGTRAAHCLRCAGLSACAGSARPLDTGYDTWIVVQPYIHQLTR